MTESRRVLYLNGSFTCARVSATFKDGWRVVEPPFDDLVDLIQPDVVVHESATRFSDHPFFEPLCKRYRSMVQGEIVDELGRPLISADRLVFISLVHFFGVSYNEPINRLEAVGARVQSVEFWKEGIVWDFQADQERSDAEISVFLKMRYFVQSAQEIANLKTARYQSSKTE